MKRFLTFCFFLLLLEVQAQHNGWEFLTWKTDSTEVQERVKKNKSHFKKSYALDADFNYQDMNTWLIYDQQHKLKQVKQRVTFSIVEKEEAQKIYEKTRQRLIKTYGPMSAESSDTTKEVITLDWDLKYTRIHLEYDYKYKIIDELGAGSYWIDILFEAK